MDVSGDGVINYEEFSKLVKSPMLKLPGCIVVRNRSLAKSGQALNRS